MICFKVFKRGLYRQAEKGRIEPLNPIGYKSNEMLKIEIKITWDLIG